MRLGHGGEKSSQAPAKMGSLKGAYTCKLELGEHDILDKKKVKFSTITHQSDGLLNCIHVSIWGPAKTISLGSHRYFVSFNDNLSRHCWIYLMRQRLEALGMMVKWKNMMENKLVGRSRSYKLLILKDTRTNSYDLVRTLVLVLTSQMEYMGWLRK